MSALLLSRALFASLGLGLGVDSDRLKLAIGE